MKKILSLLGALGMLATSASSVVACQETKKAPDDNHQKPDEKTELSLALPNRALGFIHIEEADNEEEAPSSLVEADNEEVKAEKEKAFVNISRSIVKQLMEINTDKTAVNPFELYVNLPTLINDFGDMKTIVEVYNTSKTHQGQIEVTFTIDINIRYFVPLRNFDLGAEDSNDISKYEWIEGIPEIIDSYLFKIVFENNPILNEPRFKNRVKRKTPRVEWNKELLQGRLEVVVEGYQGSIVVTYLAGPRIYDYIEENDLGDVVIDEKDMTEEWLAQELIDRLYECNSKTLKDIERSRIHFEYDNLLGIANLTIDGMIGEYIVYFNYWYYPTATNVVTDLGTILVYGSGEVTPKKLHEAWMRKNLNLDRAFTDTGPYEIKNITATSADLTVTYQGKEWNYTLNYEVKLRS